MLNVDILYEHTPCKYVSAHVYDNDK